MIFEGTKKSIFFGLGLTRAGDSFPDISVIEELSRVLDIRIQDIVIGDVTEPDSETAVTEVVRAAKLQDKVKKRKFISSVVSCIAAGYMIVCGWYSFRGHIDSSGMYYLGISLAVILVAVFLKERLIGADPNRENADKRIYNIIGFGSMAYSFIMMIIVTGIFNNHEMQSWKIDGNIGRIINVQLIIIFILNLALFIIQNYVSMRKYERETGRAYSLIGACFTSMMYSWLLHTLIDIHSFNKYMIIIAAIVIIELLAIYIIRFCVTNHR